MYLCCCCVVCVCGCMLSGSCKISNVPCVNMTSQKPRSLLVRYSPFFIPFLGFCFVSCLSLSVALFQFASEPRRSEHSPHRHHHAIFVHVCSGIAFYSTQLILRLIVAIVNVPAIETYISSVHPVCKCIHSFLVHVYIRA
jgi:hypothetical protein